MRVSVPVLGAVVLAIGLTAGCALIETVPEGESADRSTLPSDPDKSRSKKQAADFRTWVSTHGTDEQKEAATRVQRVIGEWDAKTGNAYVSTDINGGPTPVEDGMAAAAAVASAFDDWKDPEQGGSVSVYDVFGNALVVNHKF
ncbi:hypothetical protein [Streptomyces apocyni]|uniref:hypothetical protein n=1 Tax=Streptomyces apocyni TaxID=2654677 RepID=UPI0012EAB2D9|nr:hypothetical protein [Streptomyces apocyni]